MRLLLLTFTILAASVHAQDGYKIDFKIKGLKDSTVYLGYYLQEKPFVKDTARIDKKGGISFNGMTKLPEGVYFLVLSKNILFQFIVGQDQHFAIETTAPAYIDNMVVKEDDDNHLFLENTRFESREFKKAEPYIKILKDSSTSETEKHTARERFNEISRKVLDYQKEIIIKNPNTVTARILNMNRPIEIPDPPKKQNGQIDSAFQFRYYRQHYFDNFPLGDELMLRTPKVFYRDKMNDYLNKLFIQHPDTLNKAIDELALIAKASKETYKYLVWNCIINYQSPEVMGLDQVYVHLVDKYITSGEMDYWLDKKTIQNMKEHADKLRLAAIGTTAPNLVMENENNQLQSLYDIKNKYTIIFFFKPTCGHCREEAPKLVSFYQANKTKFDLEVFAVATDTSLQEMKKFIKDFSTPWITVNGPRSAMKKHFSKLYYAELTPTIYILDNKKKVVARKLAAEQLEDFLLRYEQVH